MLLAFCRMVLEQWFWCTPFLGFLLYLLLYCIFGRMPGYEPEMLRPQTGVLPMSFTHHNSLTTIVLVQGFLVQWF